LNIQPQLLTFHQLISGRLFRIPQYQRAYSWTHKERQDLFSDINRTFERAGQTHFMATVVGLKREPRIILATEFSVVDVVDGQQRLTTLIILLKAIEQALIDTTDPTEQEIRHQLQTTLVKADDVAPVLLQTNHDSSLYFLNYLQKGSRPAASDAVTIADRELLRAFDECSQFVESWAAQDRTILELVTLLRNRLYFILHEITDESLVYSVFEVLNSRGLAVSWFDRLKSALMGIAFDAQTGNADETIDQMHNVWRDIYTCVGLRQGLSTEALRFAATLNAPARPNRPLGEEEAVNVLRTATDGTAKGTLEISQWVLRVTKAVDQLHADRRLGGVTLILQARLLATSILLRHDLNPAERKSALAAWEKVSFRIFGLARKDSRTKVGDFVRLAWECRHASLSHGDLLEQIAALGADFPVDSALAPMVDVNCYNEWGEELRYFLYRYEEHLRGVAHQNFENEHWNHIWEESVSRSIEHIHAQSLGSATPTESGIFVHRLGNLLLLPPGLNSKLGNKPAADKKAAYNQTGLLIAQDVASRIPDWGRAAVIRREEELLAWAANEWGDQPVAENSK
jgi:Protein of unknown function DUF262/Protein of unknown function (DUF1524)